MTSKRKTKKTDDLPLVEFVKQAWHVIEPGTQYVHNWHVDAICEHLTAVYERQIKALLINIPPRCMKSLLVSVFYPVWTWTKKPTERFLFASYAQRLATRDAVKSRRLIQSPWFQDRWGSLFQLTSDQNEKTRYENDRTGYRISIPTGTGIGEGGDAIVWDDPHNAEQVLSDTVRESDVEWWSGSWSTRKNNPETAVEVGVMQRLHERDLSGHIISEIGGYEHLMLPMRYESDRKCTTSIGWEDPRVMENELLWPERFTEESVRLLEKKLGSYKSAGQLQQRPAPAGGNIFQKQLWKFWYPKGAGKPTPVMVRLADGSFVECEQVEIDPTDPRGFDIWVNSWDAAFKALKGNSYVAGQCWGKKGSKAFLLDQIRDHMTLPDTCQAVRLLKSRWPKTTAIWVEDKANGPAVIQTLQNEVPGLVAIDPKGDKVARAHAVSPFQEAGNVYLPHPNLFSWVDGDGGFISEVTAFPNAANNDQVDCMTQALIKLFASSSSEFKAPETKRANSRPVMGGIKEMKF